MAAVIRAGEDLHSTTAKALFKKEDITEEDRTVAKTLNFSIVYGGGTPTIQRQLSVDYRDARKLLEQYHSTWPGIRTLQNSIKSKFDGTGSIRTLFGRVLIPESDHKALNALVQGCAADLIKHSMVRVHAALDKCLSHMVLSIHDELVLDCVDSEIKLLCATIPNLMKYDQIEAKVPIDVDIEYSNKTWADKEALPKVYQ